MDTPIDSAKDFPKKLPDGSIDLGPGMLYAGTSKEDLDRRQAKGEGVKVSSFVVALEES